MRKDLNEIDQRLRNDVLEAQEEYAVLIGGDPYVIGIFLWECIYEQIEEAFGNPALAEHVMWDLILNVMGDDKISRDVQTEHRENHTDEMKKELTVDEALEGFGRMTKRIIISGQVRRIEMMREMLLHHEKALRGIQKSLDKMLRDPDYGMMFAEFLPECRYDPEYADEMIDRIATEARQRLSAHRKKIRKAAEIAQTAIDIEIERGRSYGFE